jgi:rhomboid family GlyGly-CTERM serine protease
MKLNSFVKFAWVLLCGTMILVACFIHLSSFNILDLDWQPQLAATQPWRAWTAAWVHWSDRHLVVNVAGAVLVAVLGVELRASVMCVLAFLLAWPLTHLSLGLLRPELAHYGGLSGVLHAALAVIAVQGWMQKDRASRILAAVLLLGLSIKVVSESPWGPVLRHPPQWNIAIAPLSHATGAVWGLLCCAALMFLTKGHIQHSPKTPYL